MGSNARNLSDAVIDHVIKQLEYKPAIPPTRSLNSCEGDQNGDRIEFSFDLAFALHDLSSMMVGGWLQSVPRPLSHGHVLWSYAMNFRRVKYDSFEFSLVSIGPHLNQQLKKRPDPDVNAPEDLKEPEIEVSMVILGEKEEEIMRVTLPQSLVAPKRFSMPQLIGLSVNNEISVRIRIVVDRSYFSLANIIDLDELPSVSRKRQATIDQIFRGEKPAGSLWEVTVREDHRGQGDSSGRKSFYIHKAAIEKAIPAFKNFRGFDSRRRVIKDLIKMTGPDGFKMSTLTAVDMKVIVPLIYGAPVPLPERRKKMSTLVRTIRELFKDHILTGLVVQWERAICKAALTLDTSDLADLPTIARLLAVVWASPYGSMPVAKRVAVGVMADMVHRNTNGHIAGMFQLLDSDLHRALDGQGSVMNSVMLHIKSVGGVRKTFLAASESAATAAASIPAATPTAAAAILDASIDAAAARDVVIDLPDVGEEWYDAETIDNQKEEASKWGCTIS